MYPCLVLAVQCGLRLPNKKLANDLIWPTKTEFYTQCTVLPSCECTACGPHPSTLTTHVHAQHLPTDKAMLSTQGTLQCIHLGWNLHKYNDSTPRSGYIIVHHELQLTLAVTTQL